MALPPLFGPGSNTGRTPSSSNFRLWSGLGPTSVLRYAHRKGNWVMWETDFGGRFFGTVKHITRNYVTVRVLGFARAANPRMQIFSLGARSNKEVPLRAVLRCIMSFVGPIPVVPTAFP